MDKYNYWEVYRYMDKQKMFQFRQELCLFAVKQGIKATARFYKTTVRTVRKWLRRYEEHGISGLHELSRKPKHSPNKCPDEFEQKVVELRKQTQNRFGADKLMERFSLEYGPNCIERIIRQYGLQRKRKKKYEKQNQLRSVKKLMKAFEKIQVDVKDLKDIANYYPQKFKKDLPNFEITARDVKTGATFVCLLYRNNSTNAAAFLAYLLEHLKTYGFDVKEIEIQADNGAEFFACGNAKYTQTPFEKVIHHYDCKVSRIPPRAPTFNSDVETFHRLGEDEFWAIEDFENTLDLRKQLYTYMIDFNFIRKNSYKENKTPYELLLEDYPNASKNLLNFVPLVMDENIDYFLKLNPVVAEVTKKTGKPDPFLDPHQSQLFTHWGYDVSRFHTPSTF